MSVIARLASWQHRLLWALCLIVALVLAIDPSSTPLERASLDSQHQLLREHFPQTATVPVVVVGINEHAIDHYPEPLALWHPQLGQFLSAMASAPAKTVGLDVVLPERSFDHLVPQYDRQLLLGLLAAKRQTHLVLGLTVDPSGQQRKIYAPFVSVAGTQSLGYVLLPADADNTVRRYNPRVGADGQAVPTLVGNMAKAFAAEAPAGWINYRLRHNIQLIPFEQVLRWAQQNNIAALRQTFTGKAVLLGSVLRFEDRLPQPVNLAEWEPDNNNTVPGALIHAQTLSSLLNGGLIQPAASWLLVLGLIAATGLFWLPLRLGHVVLLGSAISIGLYGVSTALLAQLVYLPVSGMLLVAWLALLSRWVVDSIAQIREKRRLRQTFSGYVSPAVMEEILAGRLMGGLSGEVREVCIMFADVRGFTTLSETMPTADVIALLNRYLDEVTLAIHRHGGTLNCIMGDGIMAIFGAPKTMSNPSEAAFAAARDLLRTLPRLNQELAAEGKPALSIGIGLNTGEAIVGHFGSRERHDYSAIGDTTNVASRLEGLSKALGYPLICSTTVAQALGYLQGLTALGPQAIKGHSNIEVYGWKEADSSSDEQG